MRVAAFAVLVGIAALLASCGSARNRVVAQQPSQAPQPTCLHGPLESPEQAARKGAALTLIRQVNTLQARAMGGSKSYQSTDQLQLPVPPAGFELRLTATPAAYAFSVRDTTDPCRFAYFSDQQGLIFHGEAIR